MGKGRRPRRGKQQSESAADPGRVADRIEALRGEVREAQADAERRAREVHQPSPHEPRSPLAVPPVVGTGAEEERPRSDGSRRRGAYAAGAVVVLAGAGVVAGVLASSSGEGGGKRTPATSGVPATTVPVTTVPVTNVPPGMSPVTTAPVSAPPASAPPVTTPPASAPPVTTPPVTTPPVSAPPPTPRSATVTVAVGDSFWSIAVRTVGQRLGTPPSTSQVTPYWASLVAANTGRLPVPGHPDLIYPGTILVLP